MLQSRAKCTAFSACQSFSE